MNRPWASCLALVISVLAVVLVWLGAFSPTPGAVPAADDGLALLEQVRTWFVGVDSPWLRGFLLAVATLISEDAAAVAAGLLYRAGEVGLWPALIGIYLGIWLGDIGLYGLGALLRRIVGPSRLDKRTRRLAEWFERKGWQAILISRLVPGSRLPLYVAIGTVGGRLLTFSLWTGVVVAVWTPIIVLGAAGIGAGLLPGLEALGLPVWLSLLLVLGAAIILINSLVGLASLEGRRRLAIRFERWRRHEFWPAWIFYLPLVPWFVWLALRHGGLTVFTAANPVIRHGGFIAESKDDLQQRLPAPWAIPAGAIEPGSVDQRLAAMERIRAENDWDFPLVLKPDAGQRGVSVRRVASVAEARDWFEQVADPAQVQPWHPGPYEAGICYYRYPGPATGTILSITHKIFPVVVGDGEHDLRELLWRDRRLRLQFDVFAERWEDRLDEVLPAGERLQLALAGNHAQGTRFEDGEHLRTPELEALIDRIARSVPGFHVGRFDIRYKDLEAFKRGEDLAIVELNGVTGESTNIYDPSWSLWRSLSLLAHQWGVAFRVGAAMAREGHSVSTVAEMAEDLFSFYGNRNAIRST